MGKSTAAAHLRELGMPVFDADAEVHRLYAGDRRSADRGGVSRHDARAARSTAALSAALLAASRGASPGSRQSCIRWCAPPSARSCRREAASGAAIAVLEIPLLFETTANDLVDATIVVSAPAEGAARSGVLQRAGHDARRRSSSCWRGRCRMPKSDAAPISLWTPAVSIEASNAALDAITRAAAHVAAATAYQRCWA